MAERKSKGHWEIAFTVLAHILALPLLLVWAAWKAFRYVRILRLAVAPWVICCNCHSRLLLVGIWRCECGYTYRGHLLLPCPICQRVPKIVRCYRCEITTKLT